jgi:hypothetical protein
MLDRSLTTNSASLRKWKDVIVVYLKILIQLLTKLRKTTKTKTKIVGNVAEIESGNFSFIKSKLLLPH